MKIDPHKHKEVYHNWKLRVQEGIRNTSKVNSDLILQYINDMEKGINISNVSIKGPRSFARLLSLKNRLIFFVNKFRELYGLEDITKINEEQLMGFFAELRAGNIKKADGEMYLSIGTYVKIFKAFWHWHMKVKKKQGEEIPDITIDLDSTQEKPKWVYLTEEQVKRLCENAKYEYKVLIMFLFDTGIRSPTELVNIQVSDLFKDFKELNIRDEISKTFGRRIKLMLCSDLIKEYIKAKGLGKDDYLFPINDKIANQYLKRLALKVLGDGVSDAGTKYSEISLYDFRHISCCYWLPRYKSESALKYRFGWKKSEKIHYYSELLGMKDTISEEDMFVDATKTELEQRLNKAERDKDIMQERVDFMEKQLQRVLEHMKVADAKVEMIEVLRCQNKI